MPSEIVCECVRAPKKLGFSIAFAESASAGRMLYEFSRVLDAGGVVLGGIICYDASLKTELLDVSPDLLAQFTAESPEVTKEMAAGLHLKIASSATIVLTGLLTPGGSETPEKPVGTVFIYLLIKGKQVSGR